MNRSVVYQETSNNFSTTDQKIMGAQIATIRHFGVGVPTGSGDFPGQLGTAVTAQGESILYVWSNAEWRVVGKSGAVDLPDEVVKEDRKNNFTEIDQTIEDCQIPYISVGTNPETTVTPIGLGHIYIRDISPVEMFISYDAVGWTPIGTTAAGTVELDKPNNFINPNQEIEGHAIMNVLKGSQAPSSMGVLPTREGELYVQVAEGTSDKKARMWISNHKGGGVYEWQALTHMFEIPDQVAMTSKSNNFQPTDQKIAGRQILTFIEGGNQNPGDAGAVPDYEGQLYVASHTNVQGNEDAAVWVARGNKWLPIQQDIDIRNVAYTNKSNRFVEPEQLLGEGGPNARWLIGARRKIDGNSPMADSKWKVQNIGEITIYKKTTVPIEYSIWMGVSKNSNPDSNAGEWAMVWSSAQSNAANVAYTNQPNEFVPFQKIDNGGRKSLINTGHEGGLASPKGVIPPVAPGDSYTQSFSHPSFGTTRNIWLAGAEADAASWKRVLCEDDHEVVLRDRPNHFTSRDQFLGDPAATKKDRVMGARINHIKDSVVYNGVTPTQVGEVVINERFDETAPGDESKKIVEAWLAVGSGMKSWLLIGRDLKTNLDYNGQDSNN